ncbi:MAG: hypothetical protein SZ59_C0006G0030 [candidate division TM6 bacterium GW2011_GWF2_28_16]|nr:MAG: hypothetical protein SZ59_C0006G0030 [candidate division TM6 bacterium GW2011_GWF2_28_16]
MLNNNFKKIKFILLILFILPSCAYKHFSRNIISKKIKHPVFITMPSNSLVFENISSIFYDILFKYYMRSGYPLSTHDKNSFKIKINLKKLEPVENFISRDLLIYNVRIGLKFDCQLFSPENKLIAEKEFEISRLVSVAKDPLNNSAFFDFEYKNLIQRAVLKIERYFRKYFLEN